MPKETKLLAEPGLEGSHGLARPYTQPCGPSPPLRWADPVRAPPLLPAAAFQAAQAAVSCLLCWAGGRPIWRPPRGGAGRQPRLAGARRRPAPLPACRAQVWPRRGRGCAFLPARPFLTHPGRVQHLPPLLSLSLCLPRPGLESRESEHWKSRAGREPQASLASGTHSL